MFLRISSASLIALVLTGCSSSDDADDSGAANSAAAPKVPCALAGSRNFTAQCGLERAQVNGKAIITLRHPDGGFRRLIELDGSKRYAAADGSDEVAIESNGAEIEVTLGEDHYLLPGPGSANAVRP